MIAAEAGADDVVAAGGENTPRGATWTARFAVGSGSARTTVFVAPGASASLGAGVRALLITSAGNLAAARIPAPSASETMNVVRILLTLSPVSADPL